MRRNRRAVRRLAGLLVGAVAASAAAGPVLTGERKVWHRITLTFEGPETGEEANPNPFTDYRLTVRFRQGDRAFEVPGYYAADGAAAETGATKGNRWRVHFVPDRPGLWRFEAWFRAGKNVAVDANPRAGRAAAFDGTRGSFEVGPTDKTGRDFRARGFLRHEGGHYLRFAGTGERFLKGGADSPENFLAYADFDGTFDTGRHKRSGEAAGVGLHHYRPHVRDWREGDPTWRGGRGKGIIGALNYLASTGMNSVYFIPYNIDGGDGKDTWPWTSPTERYRFDCSKLDQWEIVFSHMDSLGLCLHPITQETENDQGLDGGELGPQRKLYYRELIARFAHHLGLVWNLGEENTNTDAQRKAFCRYIRALDPYDHPIVCHTFPGKYEQVYRPLLGFEHFDGPSLQMGNIRATHSETLRWVVRSALAGRRWFVCHDEAGPAGTGVMPDADDPDHDAIRTHALWGNLMAGGAGCEWYFGYKYPNNDLTCEDWRSRANMWAQTRHALEFFHRYLPFWAMRSADALTAAADDYCFCAEGKIYAVYLPRGESTTLKVPAGSYTVEWYNPRTGGALRDGSVRLLHGPGTPSLGRPPADAGKDWVALVRAEGYRRLGPDSPPPRFTPADVPAGAARPARPRAGKGPSAGKGRPPAVTGFALVNADTGRAVGGFETLADGAVIGLSELPARRLTIVAGTSGDVRAVTFQLDGRDVRTERTAPYSLAGDSDGAFHPWAATVGKHVLKATARGPGGSADRTVRFEVRR